MIRFRTILVASVLAAGPALPARAQLISDEVRGERRICTYFGSDRSPNDEIVARTLAVGLGQPCPATAPYVDPNAPVPPNAALLGESTTATNRVCLYEQGGIEYRISVPLTQRCAMTPALLGPR